MGPRSSVPHGSLKVLRRAYKACEIQYEWVFFPKPYLVLDKPVEVEREMGNAAASGGDLFYPGKTKNHKLITAPARHLPRTLQKCASLKSLKGLAPAAPPCDPPPCPAKRPAFNVLAPKPFAVSRIRRPCRRNRRQSGHRSPSALAAEFIFLFENLPRPHP